MEISLDNWVFWRWGPLLVNATLVYTWLVMVLLTGGSWLVTRKLSTEPPLSRWQNLLEVVISTIAQQIQQISQQNYNHYLPFIGTLFIFISLSNLLSIIPGYHPPTDSLSTTAALALCVLVAVPLFGITQQGLRAYLGHYIKPTFLMLPFHLMSEFSRTVALAVRLFGNVMSGVMLGGILLAVVPLFFPVIMQLLELLIGQIQAFIFAVLATVYIASATQAHEERAQALGSEDQHALASSESRKEESKI
jgi:F-type H+-transporting ATPase subunit a